MAIIEKLRVLRTVWEAGCNDFEMAAGMAGIYGPQLDGARRFWSGLSAGEFRALAEMDGHRLGAEPEQINTHRMEHANAR